MKNPKIFQQLIRLTGFVSVSLEVDAAIAPFKDLPRAGKQLVIYQFLWKSPHSYYIFDQGPFVAEQEVVLYDGIPFVIKDMNDAELEGGQ